jgi:hypothetical protein
MTGYGGSVAPIATQPSRSKEIPEVMIKLQANIEELHMAISELESRLSSLIHETKPGSDQATPKNPTVFVPLAVEIDSNCTRIQYARDRVITLLDRLEI